MAVTQHPPIAQRAALASLTGLRGVLPWLVALIVGSVTFALRATHLSRSFDVFIDEVTYLRIAHGVGHNLQVTLLDKSFYLHPPLFFVLEAATLRLLHSTGTTLEQIYTLRYLNVLFASLSAGGLLLIARRLGGWTAGLIAAALFALDPFVIKMNSLVLLDTSTLWWVLAGYGLLLWGMDDTPRPLAFRRRTAAASRVATPAAAGEEPAAQVVPPAVGTSIPLWRALLAGLCFGLALLTKDLAVFVIVPPLAGAFLLGWGLPRRTTAVIGAVAGLVAVAYLLNIVRSGDWQQFVQQKFYGVQRLAGAVQISGFNRPVGPSLWDAVLYRLNQFSTTYAIIALGVVAGAIVLRRGGTASRLLLLWTASSYLLLTYCMLLGTLEEQFFYFLILPCILTVAVGATRIGSLLGTTPRRRRVLHVGLLTLALLFVGWNGRQWAIRHFTPDNGEERVLQYIAQQVPPRSRVAATNETAQFLLGPRTSGPWGQWADVAQLEQAAPDYLIVTPRTLAWNFGPAAQPLLTWIAQHGQAVFTFNGQGGETTVLYRLSNQH